MNELLVKAFDFGIRIVELAKYLEEEKRQFPLITRMLECGSGICVSLRISNEATKNSEENLAQAYKLSMETEYLLELLVKTGFINENQSIPMLTDCRLIKNQIGKLLDKKLKKL